MDHGFIRWLDDAYRARLTDSGRVLMWATLASGLLLGGGPLVFAGPPPPIVALFSFAAGALACAWALGFLLRPRLSVERVLPEPPSAGETVAYRVRVRNMGRRPARLVHVHERALPADLRPAGSAPMVERIGAGESAEVLVKLRCVERGAYELRRLQASSSFPAGLLKIPARSPAPPGDRLIVHPRPEPPGDLDLPLGRSYQPGGIACASRVGESVEFSGTREWRDGDRLRDIHWRSFARTGRPVVREFQEEYFVRLALVVDAQVRRARHQKLFERALSVTAGIADLLARRDAVIDLVAAGDRLYRFRSGRALAHLEQVLEVLACCEPTPRLDVGAVEALLVPEAESLSGAVLVMMDWDEPRLRLARALSQRGVEVRVVSMRADRRPEGLAPREVVAL